MRYLGCAHLEANLGFSLDEDVAMTTAPEATAICRANLDKEPAREDVISRDEVVFSYKETPPVPRTRT